MDANLEDSLNLEGAMESMDFDHEGVVINQGDITLEGTESVVPIQYEEQEMLMDTGNEEIIVSDFISDDQFTQEYSVQNEQTLEPGTMIQLNQMQMISQADTMLDLHLDADSMSQAVVQGVSNQPKFIAVKAALAKTTKKTETASIPKQVAIAPKPPKQPQVLQKATFASGKQYSIAPKPVALVMNKGVKKVPLTKLQAVKGNAVWSQLGKKLVMVPNDVAQKIKLVPANKSADTKQVAKSVMAKVILQGGQSALEVVNSQSSGVQPKLLPKINTAVSGTHYVMQPKTVPVSLARNKVLVGSPTKEGVRFSQKQIIAIKSPTTKMVPVTTSQPTQANTKRVVITTNPVLKTRSPTKLTQVSKDSIVMQGQPTQLHQVNVPGKGIQLIRLVSNPAQSVSKAPPPKPGSWGSLLSLPSKSYVITDTKGNIIQMSSSDKLVSSQPPPLVITGNTANTTTSTAVERKLVRIAPVTSKPASSVTTTRSTQSLLAPMATITKIKKEDTQNIVETQPVQSQHIYEEQTEYTYLETQKQCIKEEQDSNMDDVQEECEEVTEEVHEDGVYEQEYDHVEDNSNNKDKGDIIKDNEHPLIVIPSNFKTTQSSVYTENNTNDYYSDEENNTSLIEDQKPFTALVNVEAEITEYDTSKTPEPENNLVTTDLGLRPRKACNCTKSQCLKLYCDCFANGEFCNSCNCNNCNNNLEHEELRQKAIRACLERNPYAFRPKIGKSKFGGPEIIRRHNKGCNCKRSGCLKNYCECYEAKIACTSMCKCVGCRNVEETLERRREQRLRDKTKDSTFRPPLLGQVKQPCSFITSEVIEAVCQCLIAAAAESEENVPPTSDNDYAERTGSPVMDVMNEFTRCLQDIIRASHQAIIPPDEEEAC